MDTNAGNQVRRWVIICIVLISVTALGYEVWALIAGNVTISRALRDLAESYHPVYWLAGILTGFLIVYELLGEPPILIRVAVLSWIITSAHIFWWIK